MGKTTKEYMRMRCLALHGIMYRILYLIAIGYSYKRGMKHYNYYEQAYLSAIKELNAADEETNGMTTSHKEARNG